MKVLWLAPDDFGFRQYCTDLLGAANFVQKEIHLKARNEFLEPLYYQPLKKNKDIDQLVSQIGEYSPDLIHIHHEYGFLGSKIPFLYRFPDLIKKIRKDRPKIIIVCTAHTVIYPSFKYPLKGRGWQIPFRFTANLLFLPSLLKLWTKDTWGGLDGVIVHSETQLEAVRQSGCKIVRAVPHYIPDHDFIEMTAKSQKLPTLLVFGYFTPEKAQDLVIRAVSIARLPVYLILAGGVRRGADTGYFDQCKNLIKAYGIESRVKVTGFLSFDELDRYCQGTDLFVIPFRETSGSGSLADIFSRGLPALASDHPLNLEINERVPGCLEFFKMDDPESCAEKIEELLGSQKRITKLAVNAMKYAETFSAMNMAKKHLEFYLNFS